MQHHTAHRYALAAIAIGCCLLAAGCARKVTFEPPPVTTSAPTPGSAVPTDVLAPARLAKLQLGLKRAWKGFDSPLYLTNAHDGSDRLFVVEQGGLVKVIENGVVAKEPFLDLRAKTSPGGERGLLGLAFSPTFARDGRVYVDYTDVNGDTVVERYTSPLPGSSLPMWGEPERILSVKQPYPNHNGGNLVFGPDGYLYIGMGDGGSAGDPGGRAQNKDELLGKILRIDVSRPGTSTPYAIPATNPARLTADPALRPAPEVWIRGVRNPWRFSFDASSGALWVGDVGQDAWEEIDRVSGDTARAAALRGGLNFGWNRYEGTHAYPSGALVPPGARSSDLVWPVATYPHPDGESVTGGYVYHGTAYPALVGTYLFADFEKGWIAGIRMPTAGSSKVEERVLLDTKTNPASFGTDEHGELYLVDLRGSIYRVLGLAK